MNVIKAIDVQKSFSDILAVDGVSLSIKKGEIFALIGPNGAGKTTLINCLTGAASFDSGSIQILDNTPHNVAKSKISLLPQSFEPPTHLTVSELIIYFSGLYGIKTDPHHILEKVGLSSQSNKKFYELSGGQKRRICVGISIINDPEILFLDEPTTGIDPAGRFEIWDLIETMASSGSTIFLTTHYMHEVERLANNIGVISNGKIIATGTPSDLITKFGGDCTLTIKTTSNVSSAFKEFSPSFKDGNLHFNNIQPSQIGPLLTQIENLNVEYSNLTWNRPSLETVYMELMNNHPGESL